MSVSLKYLTNFMVVDETSLIRSWARTTVWFCYYLRAEESLASGSLEKKSLRLLSALEKQT